MGAFTPQGDAGDHGEYLVEGLGRGVWTTRRRNKDIYVDFEIELRSATDPTNHTAYVQVKSSTRPKLRDGNMVVTIEKEHLRYYQKALQPVFIVAVDLEAKRAYFLFVQRWLEQSRVQLDAGGPATVQVPVPMENDMEVAPQFTESVRRSWAYIRDQWVGTPEAALEKLQREYAKLDPRFEYSITAGPSGRLVELRAKVPVSLTMHLSSNGDKESNRALHDLVAFGRQPDFSKLKLVVSGSPLFEKVAGLRFEVGPLNVKKGEMVVSGLAESPYTAVYKGIFTAGREGVLFEASDPENPVSIVIRFTEKKLKTGGPLTVEASYDFSRWSGQPIATLKFFDSMRAFANAAKARVSVKLGFHVEGIFIGSGILDFSQQVPDAVVAPLPMLNLINDVRTIADWAKTEFNYPTDWKAPPEELRDIAIAYSLIRDGSCVIARHPFERTFVSGESWAFASDFKDLCAKEGTFEVSEQKIELTIFGKSVAFPDCRRIFSNVVMTPEEKECDFVKGIVTLTVRSSQIAADTIVYRAPPLPK